MSAGIVSFVFFFNAISFTVYETQIFIYREKKNNDWSVSQRQSYDIVGKNKCNKSLTDRSDLVGSLSV